MSTVCVSTTTYYIKHGMLGRTSMVKRSWMEDRLWMADTSWIVVE